MQRTAVTGKQSVPITLVQDWPEFDPDGKPAVDAAGDPIELQFATVKPKSLTGAQKKIFEQRKAQEKVLTFTYHIHTVTLIDSIEQPPEEDPEGRVRWAMGILGRRLADWDLLDGDTKVPTTPEELLGLPDQLTGAIALAINEDIRRQLPNPQIGSN